MPKQEILHPEKKVSTGAYSAGVLIDGWLYISGQGAIDMASGKVVKGGIEAQTRLTLEHIGKILAAAGMSFDDVVRCTVHLSNMKDFGRYNEVYRSFFKGILPARTTVQSVLYSGMKIEIDAIARKA